MLAFGMIGIGVLHVILLSAFTKAVPDFLPHPRILVLISGACEAAGGLGLMIPATRKLAALGLIALYLAVFPANINMAMHADRWLAPPYQSLLWLRLPFQAGFIAWAWMVRRD